MQTNKLSRPLARAAAVAGCAAALQLSCWVPIEQGQAMEADIVKLKAELGEQRKSAEQLDQRLNREREKLKQDIDKLKADQDAAGKRVDAKIREVGEALENLNRAARKTGADLGVEVEQAQGEIARLRGLVEEAQARFQSLEQAVGQLKGDSEAKLAAAADRVRQLEEEQRKAMQTAEQAAAAASRAAAEQAARERARQEEEARKKALQRPADKDDFYKLARQKLDDGDVEAAKTLLAEFVDKWKSDALAPNAQYWLGEAWYAERKYREAIFEFQKVRDNWPRSDKAADALLKIAMSFGALDLPDDAKVFFEEVVRTYPKSAAAGKAREQLDEKRKERRNK